MAKLSQTGIIIISVAAVIVVVVLVVGLAVGLTQRTTSDTSSAASGPVNFNVVELPATGDTTLTASISPATLYLPTATTNNVISLPDPAAGLYFKFIVNGVPNGSHRHFISATSNICYGPSILNQGGTVTITARTAVTTAQLSPSATVPLGDFAEYTSDGTNWYCTWMSSGTAVATWIIA